MSLRVWSEVMTSEHPDQVPGHGQTDAQPALRAVEGALALHEEIEDLRQEEVGTRRRQRARKRA